MRLNNSWFKLPILALLIMLVLLTTLTGCQKSADERVNWTFDIDWPIDDMVVKGGLVYIKTPLNIFALDKGTGDVRWKLKKRDLGKIWLGIQSFIIKDETIYVAADASENAGFTNIFALDRMTGEKKHQLKIKTNGEISSMFVDERFIYIALSKGKNNFKALYKDSFREAWTYTSEDFIFDNQIATDKDSIYLADGANVWAFYKESGKVEWKVSVNSGQEGDVSGIKLLNGVLFHNTADFVFRKTDENSTTTDYENNISAFDAKTGENKWTISTMSQQREEDLTFDKSSIFIEKNGYIAAFDIKTGKQLWKAIPKDEEVSTRIISDGRLYLWGNNLDIFDVKTGKLIRSAAVANQTVLLDVIKDTIYSGRLGSPESGDNKNIIYSTNAKTGKEKWRLKLEWGYKNKGGEGYNISTPVISGDSLFFAASDLNEGGYGAGRLYSIKL